MENDKRSRESIRKLMDPESKKKTYGLSLTKSEMEKLLELTQQKGYRNYSEMIVQQFKLNK